LRLVARQRSVDQAGPQALPQHRSLTDRIHPGFGGVGMGGEGGTIAHAKHPPVVERVQAVADQQKASGIQRQTTPAEHRGRGRSAQPDGQIGSTGVAVVQLDRVSIHPAHGPAGMRRNLFVSQDARGAAAKDRGIAAQHNGRSLEHGHLTRLPDSGQRSLKRTRHLKAGRPTTNDRNTAGAAVFFPHQGLETLTQRGDLREGFEQDRMPCDGFGLSPRSLGAEVERDQIVVDRVGLSQPQRPPVRVETKRSGLDEAPLRPPDQAGNIDSDSVWRVGPGHIPGQHPRVVVIGVQRDNAQLDVRQGSEETPPQHFKMGVAGSDENETGGLVGASESGMLQHTMTGETCVSLAADASQP